MSKFGNGHTVVSCSMLSFYAAEIRIATQCLLSCARYAHDNIETMGVVADGYSTTKRGLLHEFQKIDAGIQP